MKALDAPVRGLQSDGAGEVWLWTAQALHSFDLSGAPRWISELEGVRRALPLNPHALAALSDETVHFLQRADGKVLHRVKLDAPLLSATASDGALILHGTSHLSLVDASGATRWKTEVPEGSVFPPERMGDELLLPQGEYVRRFDLSGRPNGGFSASGFFEGEPPEGLGGPTRTPLLRVGPTRLIVAFREAEPAGLFSVDLVRRTVLRIPSPWTPSTLVAVDARGIFSTRQSPAAFGVWSEDGRLQWKREEIARLPTAARFNANGELGLVVSPTLAQWRDYRDSYALERQCHFTVYNPSGEPRQSWRFDEPLLPYVEPLEDGSWLVATRARAHVLTTR